MGLQALQLRSLAGPDGIGDRLREALKRLAMRDVDGMLAGLHDVEAELSTTAGRSDLRIPTSIRVVRDVVRQHRHEFEEG
jgi:hypothetical protein